MKINKMKYYQGPTEVIPQESEEEANSSRAPSPK